MRRWMALFAGLALLSGCGTISSGASGCGGPWSGVRHDADLLGSYRSESLAARELPLGIDGWLGDAWDSVAVALDLPFSALVDTLSTPVTYSLGQRTPEPVGLGCEWAAPGSS
jgi:uncharacterized protein YceK